MLLALSSYAHGVSFELREFPGLAGTGFVRPIAEAWRRSGPSLLPMVDKGVESRSSDSSLMPGRPFLNRSQAGQLQAGPRLPTG